MSRGGPFSAPVTVKHVLIGGTRPMLAVLATALIATCSGCGSQPPPSSGSRSVSSLVTPTTQIAGAGVLGNDRKADASCAPDAAKPDWGADPGPSTRPAHNAAGGNP